MLETKFQLTIWDSHGWKFRKHLYNFYFLLTFVELLIPEPDPNDPNKLLRSQHYCTKYLADPPNTMELIFVIFIESVILVYTISPCQNHESLSIPWVLGITMSPCQYHESLSIPWVLVNTMSSCQYHESMSITWVLVNSKRYLRVQVVPKA